MSVTDTSASVHNAATPMEMLCINTIRTLSMDAVQAANSGHPGTPMAMAPLAYCLWQEFVRYDPSDPLGLGDGESARTSDRSHQVNRRQRRPG